MKPVKLSGKLRGSCRCWIEQLLTRHLVVTKITPISGKSQIGITRTGKPLPGRRGASHLTGELKMQPSFSFETMILFGWVEKLNTPSINSARHGPEHTGDAVLTKIPFAGLNTSRKLWVCG